MKRLVLLQTFFYTLLFRITSVYAFNTSYLKPSLNKKIQAFQQECGTLINGLLGFFLASSVLIMIVHFIRLGQYGDKPVMRAKVMNDMLITGICTAGIGSLWVVYGLVMVIAVG